MNKNGIHLNLAADGTEVCSAIAQLISKRMSAEKERLENERQKIIAVNKKRTSFLQSRKTSEKDALRKKIKRERLDSAQKYKPSVSSNARQLNFGRKDVKLKFKSG